MGRRSVAEIITDLNLKYVGMAEGLGTPCIEYGNRPYASVKYAGKVTHVHRVAWILIRGDIPDGMHICHMCDNSKCVNVLHLFLGTHSDNMKDASLKGRWPNRINGRHHFSRKTHCPVGHEYT